MLIYWWLIDFFDSVCFQSWKKTESMKCGDSVFFTAFPPHVWDSVFFQSWNVQTPLSPTSSCILEPGFWLWLPGVLWHYNLHQMKLKDFAPKKNNLLMIDWLMIDWFVIDLQLIYNWFIIDWWLIGWWLIHDWFMMDWLMID